MSLLVATGDVLPPQNGVWSDFQSDFGLPELTRIPGIFGDTELYEKRALALDVAKLAAFYPLNLPQRSLNNAL